MPNSRTRAGRTEGGRSTRTRDEHEEVVDAERCQQVRRPVREARVGSCSPVHGDAEAEADHDPRSTAERGGPKPYVLPRRRHQIHHQHGEHDRAEGRPCQRPKDVNVTGVKDYRPRDYCR